MEIVESQNGFSMVLLWSANTGLDNDLAPSSRQAISTPTMAYYTDLSMRHSMN